MRTELQQKLLANVILSTKTEPLSIKRLRHSAMTGGTVFYLVVAMCGAVFGLLALIYLKWN